MIRIGRALSIGQCLQYALDRPAVLSCLLGVASLGELQQALAFYGSSEADRDYSWIGAVQPKEMRGVCVYCNHCLPCPADIDIAAVQKFYDLYQAGDDLAKEHYYALAQNATDCIQCGNCESRCPFGVKVYRKMEDISREMG